MRAEAGFEDRVTKVIAGAGAGLDALEGIGAYLSGGKRLRASVVLAVAKGGAASAAEVARYAAVVELLHTGGLCHDDIVDRSAHRRDAVSLAFSAGRAAATWTGVHLVMRAWALVAGETQELRRLVAAAADRVATGQADEMADLYRTDLPASRYLERCRLKTGALFELAAELGAAAARMGEARRARFGRWGGEVGLAYQLIDDVRDLTGEAVAGRMPGTDLREGVMSLPVLLTVHGRHPGGVEVRRRLREIRHAADPLPGIEAIRDVLVRNGAVAATEQQAMLAMERGRREVADEPRHVRDALEHVVARIGSACGGTEKAA